MKILTLLAVTVGALILPACESSKSARAGKLEFTATAYSSGSQCNGPWAHRNALGGELKSGPVTSAAADWSRLPVGTKFRVQETGRIYQVDDYGSAMVGKNKVDLYKTNYRDVYHWGVRNVTLEILEWGCPVESLAILRPRSHYQHVKAMVEQLETETKDAS
jgi:3D (Asp-Asp-Asp) domain-containing protein